MRHWHVSHTRKVVIKTTDKVSVIVKAASDKKAKDVVVMDMERLSQICDYFIIASGTSARQVKAIADNIKQETRRRGFRTYHSEGYNEGIWVLLDYHDVIMHIFMEDARKFYDLERLWADASVCRI